MSDVAYKRAKRPDLYKRYGRSIRVNRTDYKVIFCEEVLNEGKPVTGLCVPSERVLLIKTDDPIEETLLHEICHAEFQEGGFVQRSDWDEKLEEQMAETIARAISHNYTLKKK